MTNPDSRQAYPVCLANRHFLALETLNRMLEPLPSGEGLKLRVLAKRLDVSAGYLSQIVRGKRAPSAKVYRALGLPQPARIVEVAAGFDVAPCCPKCSNVHTTKRCTKGKRAKPRRVAYKWQGRRMYQHEGTDQI